MATISAFAASTLTSGFRRADRGQTEVIAAAQRTWRVSVKLPNGRNKSSSRATVNDLRQHTDHRDRRFVKRRAAGRWRRRAAEFTLPEAMADERDARHTGFVVLGGEVAAKGGFHAKRREQLAVICRRLQPARLVDAGQIARQPAPCGEVLERRWRVRASRESWATARLRHCPRPNSRASITTIRLARSATAAAGCRRPANKQSSSPRCRAPGSRSRRRQTPARA